MTSAFTRVPRTVALAALACLAGGAQAQQPAAYPAKPIQLIAQQPPGSGSDAMTRVWADCAARELGQPVVVQNKPGANGIMAVNYLKAQPADGYNLLSIGMSQMTITPYVYKQQPYDPLRDFDGVAVLGTSPLVLAVPAGQGIASLADLQKLARSTPGGINFGSPGKGSPAHLLTSALIEKLGVPGTHVPFVGEGAGLTALMGQQIHAMTLVIGTAAAQVKANKLVPLALFGALVFTFLKIPDPNTPFPLTDGWTTTLNIYSKVGLVTLMGLIAKNGILIVEFANKLQIDGRAKLEAVREAALIRLRPILMTSAATIAGHLPLTLVTGAGAAARNSIGLVLVGGIAIGTLFTLVFVPTLYMLIARDHAHDRDAERAATLAHA